MADAFDVHAHRHELKLLADEGDRAFFENREGVTCPVCETPFDELLALRGDAAQVNLDRSLDLCLRRTAETTYVFTHARVTEGREGGDET